MGLIKCLEETPDHLVGASVVVEELIANGSAGISAVVERLSRVVDKKARAEAFFNFVAACYRLGQKKEALENLGKIDDQEQTNRCLVQLACHVLEKEKDLTKAEEFIAQVVNDAEGYLDLWQRTKKNLGYAEKMD